MDKSIRLKKSGKILFMLFLLSSLAAIGQQKDSVRVEIYTAEERDNLQYWFHENVGPMKMTDTTSAQYFNVLTKYGYKMARLNDKDQSYSKEELMTRLDELIVLQNKEIRNILNEEQYQLHLENYKDIIYSIKTRLKREE